MVTQRRRIKWRKVSTWIAIGINFIGLVFLGFTTFRSVGPEKIEIKYYDYVGLGLNLDKIFVNHHLSLKNYGKSPGAISSMEAFLISKKRDEQGNPKYMRHFSDVYYYNTEYNGPFLGCFVYPNEMRENAFNIYQKNPNGFGLFEAGGYEYLIVIYDNNEEKIPCEYFEFNIDNSQIINILANRLEYIKLVPIQEQHKKDELWNTFKSFPKEPLDDSYLGCDDIFVPIFTVIFDPNGGTGGNGSQTIPEGTFVPLDGGIPIRSGYKFLYWSTAPDGSGTIHHNEWNQRIWSDERFYAVWEKDL